MPGLCSRFPTAWFRLTRAERERERVCVCVCVCVGTHRCEDVASPAMTTGKCTNWIAEEPEEYLVAKNVRLWKERATKCCGSFAALIFNHGFFDLLPAYNLHAAGLVDAPHRLQSLSIHTTSSQIRSNHNDNNHTMSYHAISKHNMSYHITSFHTISHRIISRRVISRHIVMLSHIASYDVISFHVTCCHIMSHRIIPYHIMSDAGENQMSKTT